MFTYQYTVSHRMLKQGWIQHDLFGTGGGGLKLFLSSVCREIVVCIKVVLMFY